MCSDKQDSGSEREAGNHVAVNQISTLTDLVDAVFHTIWKSKASTNIYAMHIHLQYTFTKSLQNNNPCAFSR